MSAEVAVKCDLCRGQDGPECVSACPTDAIFRLDPERDVVEVRAASGKKPSASRAARVTRRPWRSLLALSIVPPVLALDGSLAAGHRARFVAGVLASLLVALLSAHALVKRVPRVRRTMRRLLAVSAAVSTLAPLVSFHAASGVAAVLCVYVHAGLRVPGGLLGTLVVSFWSVAASGACGAVVYRFVPERWASLEQTSTLPEDELGERERLVDRLHAELTGENPAKKELVRRLLIPYATSLGGALALAASGRARDDEEKAVRASIDAALGGRTSERLAGLDALVRTAVDMRALRAKRVLRALLRAWLPVHLALSALVGVLLVLHIAGVLR
jgi:hypothetical protein